VIHGIAIQEALEHGGLETRLISAISMQEIGEPFIVRRAKRTSRERGECIFARWTGSPYFTTGYHRHIKGLRGFGAGYY